uniref:Uncharacterized protein n=1 Tax=Trichobilharzia regenti TaxID=157069 RepID=A0AA85JTP8_TRIRE|nr:unnamed protein product [Trichobilharzia regenti]
MIISDCFRHSWNWITHLNLKSIKVQTERMKMIVSRMLMTAIVLSVIVNSIVASDCYECQNCKHVDRSTPRRSNCGGCLKYVYHGQGNRVDRQCVATCNGVQQTTDYRVYCCRGNLCNSSSKVTLNATFIYSILFIAVTTIFYNK